MDEWTFEMATPVARVLQTAEMEERLADMWQEYNCQYNKSSKTYHNHMAKEKSFTKASCCMSLSILLTSASP